MLKNIVELLKPPVDPDVKITGVAMFFGRWMEAINRRVVDLESRQLQKGDKGDKGDPGPQGKNGLDGRNGIDGRSGLNGKDGKDGKDGLDGKTGVSVVDAEIAADDHLVLKLSSGKIIDAGELPKAEGQTQVHVSGNAWQITVSATAPTNPQLNQLWYDIS